MANLEIKSNGKYVDFVFNDYAGIGILEGANIISNASKLKSDIYEIVTITNEDNNSFLRIRIRGVDKPRLVTFNDGIVTKAAALQYKTLIVDAVDGVNPESLSDLKAKIMAILNS